ncbi:MAG TPA: hypothetical protein VL334_06550, partial [Anaerolineae bacterium]|nr:hypothetical protein [Anaerolineae bacterium]
MQRQCQLRLGNEQQTYAQTVLVDLTIDPYRLLAGTWNDDKPGLLETSILLQGETLTEIERQASGVRRMIAMAQAWATSMQGKPVYVYHKLCDDFERTAELGATWQRKQIYNGRLELPDMQASGKKHYGVKAKLVLEVEELWQRAAPESVVYGSSDVRPHATRRGGILSISGAQVTARLRWYPNYGLSCRYHWAKTGNNCTF